MVVKYRQHNSERHIMFLSCEIQKAEHGEECHVIVKYSSTWGDMSCSCEIQQNMKRYGNLSCSCSFPILDKIECKMAD